MGIKIIEIKDLNKLLEVIREHPCVWLGSKSITALHDFINGYQAACLLKGQQETHVPDFGVGGFHDFVADYFLYGESTAGWKNMILATHFGNEEAAFDDFYKLLDLFMEHPKTTNAKKILYRIVKEMVAMQSAMLHKSDEEKSQIIDYFKDLPDRLMLLKFEYEYDHILGDLREAAANETVILKFLDEMSVFKPAE